MTKLDAILDHVDDQLDASLDRWFDLLRIPSISTDPQYTDECRKAGQWVTDELAGMGLTQAFATRLVTRWWSAITMVLREARMSCSMVTMMSSLPNRSTNGRHRHSSRSA